MTIRCTHQGCHKESRVCTHLLDAPDSDHARYFSGQGLRYHLLCHPCADQFRTGEAPSLTPICEACFNEIEEQGFWDGIVGRPEVLSAPTMLSMTHHLVELPGLSAQDVLDIQPLQHPPGEWIAVTRAGALVRVDFERRAVSIITKFDASPLDLSQRLSMELAPDGQFAALANTFGERGIVVDLHSGRITMPFQREAYHNNVTPFPIAFFQHDNASLLVHATEWNRLDISNPATGKLLTTRESPRYSENRESEYYLDYFHGRLRASPAGRWIADDGWAWHPVGSIRSWSLQRWMEENLWESEDGETVQYLCNREYFWGGPLCWMNERHLAVWGYGRDEYLIPAIRIFDVVTNTELRWFAGVEIESHGDGQKLGRQGGSLVYDGHLYALSDKHGLSAWDPEVGTCLFRDPTLTPTAYDRGSKTFLSLLPERPFRLSRFD